MIAWTRVIEFERVFCISTEGPSIMDALKHRWNVSTRPRVFYTGRKRAGGNRAGEHAKDEQGSASVRLPSGAGATGHPNLPTTRRRPNR